MFSGRSSDGPHNIKDHLAEPRDTGTHTTTTPVVFGFDGEYSIVSTRENVGGKRGIEETCKRVRKILQEIERSCGLKFRYVVSDIYSGLFLFVWEATLTCKSAQRLPS